MLATDLEDPEEILKLLLTHGADPTLVNNDGNTALDIARTHDNQQAVEILESAENSLEGDEESL